VWLHLLVSGKGKCEGNGGKTTKGISSTSDALCGGLTLKDENQDS
jgi:hypothetical protein